MVQGNVIKYSENQIKKHQVHKQWGRGMKV